MTVKEAARRAGTSVRALRYYEQAGLIRPGRSPESGYRDYDGAAVARARQIRAYRELQLSLAQIARLLDAPRAERNAILEAHIRQMEAQKQRLQNRIDLARSLRMLGPERFAELDFAQVDDQMARMRRNLNADPEWTALSERFQRMSHKQMDEAMDELLHRLADVANAPEPEISNAIDRLRTFITENLYPCTDAILLYYARSFGGDGLLAQTLEEIAGPNAAPKLRERLESQIQSPA